MGAEVAGKQDTCKNCNLSLDFGLDQDHVQGQTLKAKAKACNPQGQGLDPQGQSEGHNFVALRPRPRLNITDA